MRYFRLSEQAQNISVFQSRWKSRSFLCVNAPKVFSHTSMVPLQMYCKKVKIAITILDENIWSCEDVELYDIDKKLRNGSIDQQSDWQWGGVDTKCRLSSRKLFTFSYLYLTRLPSVLRIFCRGNLTASSFNQFTLVEPLMILVLAKTRVLGWNIT